MRTVPGRQKGRMGVTDQRTSPGIASILPWGTRKFFIPISLVLLTCLPSSIPLSLNIPEPHMSCLFLSIYL